MTEVDSAARAGDRAVTDRPRTKREEHSEDTRRALIDAARGLFAEKGFAGAGTVEILERARVARGGMYHHFATKQELFRAVLEVVERDFITRMVEEGAPGDNVWDEICNGCQAFLDQALDPEVQRIVLLDGPAVLGWEAWREIEEKNGFGLLRDFLQQAAAQGFIEDQPIGPLTHLLSGALNEAAMMIAHATERTATRKEVGEALTRLLDHMRAR